MQHRRRKQNMSRHTSYRKRLNDILRIVEKRHYNEVFDQNKQKKSKVWNVTNGIIGKSKRTINNIFKLNNITLTALKDIANQFHIFFTNILPSAAEKSGRCSR